MLAGSLDRTHITVAAPEHESKVGQFDRKQRYSINTQAAFNGDSIFLSVATGYSGSLGDSRVLRNSNLFQRAENEAIKCYYDVIENDGSLLRKSVNS